MEKREWTRDDYLRPCRGCGSPTHRSLCEECTWDRNAYQREMWSQPKEKDDGE